MKRVYIPIIALAIGFANACLAFQVHSMLFCFLPLWAFALGHFSSSWKTGLLSSFLLFIGYTTATAFMRAPIHSFDIADYLFNFIYGGFILCIIGCGAPTVKRGAKSFKSISVLVVLVLLVAWCGYSSFPKYSYLYSVTVEPSEDLDSLELYLPIGAVSQKPYTEIYVHLFDVPHGPAQPASESEPNYSFKVIDTAYGKMLSLNIFDLEKKWPDKAPQSSCNYIQGIMFHTLHAPQDKIEFLPKYDVATVGIVTSERFLGPIKVRAREIVEEFEVPIKVSSHEQAEIKIQLNHHCGRRASINFATGKGESYSETAKLQTATSDEWILVAGEAVRSIGVWGRD